MWNHFNNYVYLAELTCVLKFVVQKINVVFEKK